MHLCSNVQKNNLEREIHVRFCTPRNAGFGYWTFSVKEADLELPFPSSAVSV